MAPLPHNNTITGWLEYTMDGVGHEMVLRFADGTTDTAAANAATGIANALRGIMPVTDSFSGFRIRAKNSLLSFPVVFAAVVGQNAGAKAEGNKPNFLSLTGRTANGRRARCTFFCVFQEPDANYRTGPGESSFVTAWRDQLMLSANNIVGIDGAPVVWNTYANQGTNAYWQRQMRKG